MLIIICYIISVGDLPALTVLKDASSPVTFNSSVVETTKGRSSFTHFHFTQFGMVSPAIPVNPTTLQVDHYMLRYKCIYVIICNMN